MDAESWIDYVIDHPSVSTHKAIISRDDVDHVFSVMATKLPGDPRESRREHERLDPPEPALSAVDEVQEHLAVALHGA